MSAMDRIPSRLSPVALPSGDAQTYASAVKQDSPAAPLQRLSGASMDSRIEGGGDFAFPRASGEESDRQSQSRETDAVENSVSETNRSLALENRSLRFRVHEDYGELQVQIVDSSRDKVIRSIPSDEMMRLASRMRELSGVGAMVDESR